MLPRQVSCHYCASHLQPRNLGSNSRWNLSSRFSTLHVNILMFGVEGTGGLQGLKAMLGACVVGGKTGR